MLYAQLIDGQSPRGLQAEDCLSCQLDEAVTAEGNHSEIKQHLDKVTESNYQEALEILRSALSLKANAGGAIKVEIKRALDLLDLQASIDNDTQSS